MWALPSRWAVPLTFPPSSCRCWDAAFAGVGVLPFGGAPYLVGSMRNFLELADAEGAVPGCLTPAGASTTLAHAKPVIIWSLWLAARSTGDVVSLAPLADKMRALLRFWDMSRSDARTGLVVWYDTMECGADDLPWARVASKHTPAWDESRDAYALAAPDAHTFLAMEHRAFALFLEAWGGAPDEVRLHRARARAIMRAMNEHLWRWEDDGDAAPAALAGAAPVVAPSAARGLYVAYDVKERTPLVRRTYQAAWPLWQGMAPSNAARDAAIATILSPDLWAAHGIRSTSNLDPAYTLQDVITPYSNWRGPVWINVNIVLAYTLASCGKTTEALELGRRLVAMLARDIRARGGMHECYDGDSGEPLASASLNFLSWNCLAASLLENLEAGVNPFLLGDEDVWRVDSEDA